MNESQKRDAAWMASEDNWIGWPYLPVISRENRDIIGLMVAGKGPKVYVGLNIWSRTGSPVWLHTYASFEDCAKEWRVD